MSVCEAVAVTQTVLEKIESFMNDSAYKEMLENSSRYNSRLSAERRIRLPFVDNHTGVAQTHSDLFKNARQRMPGFREAQVYTYPSKRWCKRRRQYLMTSTNGRRMDREDDNSNTGDNLILNEDSKDSSGLKDEVSKDQWYYEDEMMEMDAFEDHDVDSDYDYDEHYRSGRKKKRPGKPSTRSRGSSRSTATNSPKGDPETPASGGRGGRGRKRALLYDMDNDKPFACELCSARYKTRPGLTYHYTHTHKETKECDVSTPESAKEETAERASPKPAATPPQPGSQQPATAGAGAASTSASPGPPQPPPNSSSKDLAAPGAGGSNNRRRGGGGVAHASASAVPPVVGVPAVPQHQHHGPQAQPPKPPKDDKPSSPATHKLPDTPEMDPYRNMALSDDKARVAPSPYCDFCLGDSAENRKTSTPEELVSCSDCGRSGHPSCLQFTPNMIRSVRKYRWQCIECKCCSICGTSDNDDQLLFCDDCDRGYHMYCLAPPLTTPPEGSWSCGLCMVEFHRRGK